MIEILGIKLKPVSSSQALKKVAFFLTQNNQHLIVTLNPEMAVNAQKDSSFKRILNQASLVLNDGVGISLAGWFLKRVRIPRVPGVDFVKTLCQFSAEKGLRIFLFGGQKKVVKKAAQVLEAEMPGLKIAGALPGEIPEIRALSPYSNRIQDYLFPKINQKINRVHPDILLVGLGSPKQEKWIWANLKKMPGVKIAMGVGGSFDILAGETKPAPNIMRRWGLEWLWRFFWQPWRYKRIFKAVVVFPCLVIKQLLLDILRK